MKEQTFIATPQSVVSHNLPKVYPADRTRELHVVFEDIPTDEALAVLASILRAGPVQITRLAPYTDIELINELRDATKALSDVHGPLVLDAKLGYTDLASELVKYATSVINTVTAFDKIALTEGLI